jgi:hypothetical protein
MLARPWEPPAAHWPDLPGVVGGRDTLAGGTWLALNRHGVVAGVLNRTGSLGPQTGKRSRGELPLMALRHANAATAAAELAALDGAEWRSFNLIVADQATAHLVRGLGDPQIEAIPLPPGLSMVTASDPNDPTHPRVARHLPRFQAATPPNPPDWGEWPALLADRVGPWDATLNVPPTRGFGTASSALIGIRPGHTTFHFAAGPPGKVSFREVELEGMPGALPLDPALGTSPQTPLLGRENRRGLGTCAHAYLTPSCSPD